MKDDGSEILIDHIIGSFDESISPIGKPNSLVFSPIYFNEVKRTPEMEIMGFEKDSGKIVLDFPGDTN